MFVRSVFRVAAAALFVAGLCFGLADKKKNRGKPMTASELYKRSVPAVAAIDCFGPEGRKIAMGSGFVASANGKVFTNLHVILPCASVTVRLGNGDAYDSPAVMEVDNRKDIALIHVKGANLPFLALADSNDVEIGQTVFSIGNPSGLQNTLQQGLVSGFRQMDGYKLMQVSASINPGNSGGPILDAYGEVIAISSAKINGAENLGFAIPSNYASGYLDSRNEMPFNLFAEAVKRAMAANAAKQAGPGTAGPAGVMGGVVGGVASGGGIGSGVAAPPPPPPWLKEKPANSKRISVGGAVQQAKLIRRVSPAYPALALQSRITGTVKIRAVIGKDGTIQEADVLSGHPLLSAAALSAVKQWVYQPTLLNGEAVEVATQIDVNFNLTGPDNAAAELPLEIPLPPPTGTGAAIQVNSDKLIAFLKSHIGEWTSADALNALGETGSRGPFQVGDRYTVYEFPAAGTEFRSAVLRFASGSGKLANIVFLPAKTIKWDDQLAVMKQLNGGAEPRTVAHGGDTTYEFSRTRTSFDVRADGSVALVVVY